jgi:uncharacterized membrane protein YraQ (UPF0718 family)
MDVFYPIQLLSNWIVSLLKLENNIFGGALNYFIYDSIKILILLGVVIFAVSYIRTYLSPERIRKILSKENEYVGNAVASTIGIFTPFCTCSAVPLFIGFIESGVPLGVTFSYLISAPLINEIAAVLLLGLFGWKIATLYIVSGWLISFFAGIILGRMKLERFVESYARKAKIKQCGCSRNKLDRIKESFEDTKEIIKKVYPYVLIGIAIGAIIHGYAPENFLSQIAGRDNLLAVPIAVLIGVPLYSNAAGIIPVITSLIGKGLPVGTALAFMMSVVALSLPEMIILRKVLKPKLLAIFISVVALSIIFTGYLFNILI